MDFDFEIDGLSVRFFNRTVFSANTWSWSFGDTAESTVREPRHTYATGGTYTVTLTATCGAKTSMVSKILKVNSVLPPILECVYEPVTSFAQAGETAWKQVVKQLVTEDDWDDNINESGYLSADGKRVILTRRGFGVASEQRGAWVIDTTQKPNNSSGSYRGFWIDGMVPAATLSQAMLAFQGDQQISRTYDFIGNLSSYDDPPAPNWTWRSSDYADPEIDSNISQWTAISGNGKTRVGSTTEGVAIIRCDGEPDFQLPAGEGKLNYCGTRMIGQDENGANGFWDKTGPGTWEFTLRPIQPEWENDEVVMTHINGEGNVIMGYRKIYPEDGPTIEYLVRWVDGVPTAYLNEDGFTLDLLSEDGSTAVSHEIYNLGSRPSTIWDPVNGFRNLYEIIDGVPVLFVTSGDLPWETYYVTVWGISANGKHLLVRLESGNFDNGQLLQYVYLGD